MLFCVGLFTISIIQCILSINNHFDFTNNLYYFFTDCFSPKKKTISYKHTGQACGIANKSDYLSKDQLIGKDKPDFVKIKQGISDLDLFINYTKYSKPKSTLQAELEVFLRHLEPTKSLANTSPDDIRQFLLSKESKGNPNCITHRAN